MKSALDAKNEITFNWMRPDAASIQASATIEEAAERMKKFRIHHLVVKEGPEYRGILEARDIAGVWEKNDIVSTVMRKEIPLVDETTDIKAVVEMMVNRDLTAVPVRKDDKVCGIITTTDLIRLFEIELSRQGGFSKFLHRGAGFLARPVIQTLSWLVGNAGV